MDHPPVPVLVRFGNRRYDLRDVALALVDFESCATKGRLMDVWHYLSDEGKPTKFLNYDLELLAARMVIVIARGETFEAPADYHPVVMETR